MDIYKITLPEFFVGNGTVDASVKQLVAAGYQPMTLSKGVTVRADSGNTDTIYVGGSGVSSANGFSLAAGEEMTIAIDDIHKVYVVGAASTPAYSWIAQ